MGIGKCMFWIKQIKLLYKYVGNELTIVEKQNVLHTDVYMVYVSVCVTNTFIRGKLQ
jgi:hypothetical protein